MCMRVFNKGFKTQCFCCVGCVSGLIYYKLRAVQQD